MTFSEVGTTRFQGMVSLLLFLRKKNGDVCHVYFFGKEKVIMCIQFGAY
jgi:hypothetical protein